MHMYDMVKIDTIVFDIVWGGGGAFKAPTTDWIGLNRHIYIPNQAICVAKLCFYCIYSLKNSHQCSGHVTLTLTLNFNFFEKPMHIRVLYLQTKFYKN